MTRRAQVGTELLLAAGAAQIDDHPLGDAPGEIVAVIGRHEGQREVDSGRYSR